MMYASHQIHTVHCNDSGRPATIFDRSSLPQHLDIRAEADIIISAAVFVDIKRDETLSSQLMSHFSSYVKLVGISIAISRTIRMTVYS